MADIDGRAVFDKRLLDNLDGALDPGAKTPGIGQQDTQSRGRGFLQGRPRGRRQFHLHHLVHSGIQSDFATLFKGDDLPKVAARVLGLREGI
jgi:hypothetical protein